MGAPPVDAGAGHVIFAALAPPVALTLRAIEGIESVAAGQPRSGITAVTIGPGAWTATPAASVGAMSAAPVTEGSAWYTLEPGSQGEGANNFRPCPPAAAIVSGSEKKRSPLVTAFPRSVDGESRSTIGLPDPVVIARSKMAGTPS